MIVRDYMTPHPILVEPAMRVVDAQKLMTENNIRHLPVVGNGKCLLGLVTHARLAVPVERLASLNVWEITRFLSDLTVRQMMLTGADLHTTQPDATLEEAAQLLIQNKLTGLVVVEPGGDAVIGIITDTDLLVELQNLLGAIDAGWRAVMRVPDRLGEFRKVARVIGDRNWGIMAMGSVRSPRQSGSWDIILKVRHCSREELTAALTSIPGQELVDLRETLATKTSQ